MSPGRDLTPDELERHAAQLAQTPQRWQHLVTHDPGARVYEEISSDEHVTAWLICWMDDHDTGFHDHDRSNGAVAVISGAVREDRLVVGGPPASRTVAAGGSFSFEAADIHRVQHAGDVPAVTIHVYSPPLRAMGAYEIREGGVLARHAIDADEELRPLEEAA